MDDLTRKNLDKEIDKTIKKASEEVRGRELTPTSVEVKVIIRTKELENVIHFGEPVKVTPPAKK